MKFYMPVRVYDEENCVMRHAAELAALGKRALIVTGRHSAVKCGALDDVCAALEMHGRSWSVFSEVEENPSVETVLKARDFGISEQADFVIGIGGGSPMDAAKAIALMLFHRDCGAESFYDPELSADALPVAAVPTTCGTGSEVTGVSVLTRHDKKIKASIPQRIFPRLALIDGKYLQAAPLSVIAGTALDALAHMLESALMKSADDYSRMAVSSGLSVWSRAKEVLTGEREPSAEDFAALMRASTFAGMAIAQNGTSLPHALSYALTYDTGLAHGRAVGYFLPGFLGEAPEGIRQPLLTKAGFSGLEEFEAFTEKVLGEVRIPSETMERAYEMVSKNASRMNGCVFPVDEAALRRIMRA